MQQHIISQTFNVADNYNTNGIFYESVAISKSAIYTNGYGSEISSPLNPKLYISKLTKKGGFIYNKGYTEPGLALFSSPQGLMVKNDSVFNFGQAQGNGYFNRIICLITDTNGNKLFFKEYLDSINENEVMFQSQLFKSKKGFLLVGLVQKSSTLDVNAGVFFLNNKLEMTRKYEFGISNKNEIAYSATQLANGNIVIGAHRYDANKISSTRYKEQTWIFEIDTAGNMVHEFLDPDTRTGPAKGITQTADGGFVYCGKYQSNWNGKISYKWQGSIAKLKPDFSGKDWEIKIPDTLSSLVSMEDIEFLNQNELVAAGSNVTYSYNYPNDSAISGVVISFNQNGEIYWQNNYLGLDSNDQTYLNFLYDLEITPNKEILACGKSYGSQTPNSGWILKLDSTGCLSETNCGAASLSVENEQKKGSQKLNIYPNPFTSSITLHNNESIKVITIYNQIGQVVYKKENPTKELHLPHLPNGLYFLKVITQNREVITKKIIKQ